MRDAGLAGAQAFGGAGEVAEFDHGLKTLDLTEIEHRGIHTDFGMNIYRLCVLMNKKILR